MDPSQRDTAESIDGAKQKLDLNKPCRVAKVNFEGLKRTRPALVSKIIADIFNSKSLLDFLERTAVVRKNLETLGAFSQIDITVEPVDEDACEVTFAMKERLGLQARVQTAVDNHSTHLSFDLNFPNRLGIGDKLEFKSKIDKKFYSGECRFSVPISPWRDLWSPKVSAAYSQYLWNNMPSGFDQDDKALSLQVDFLSKPQLQHIVSFDNIWRHLKCSSSLTPSVIREQMGHSVKSSLKHVMTWDNRFETNFPSEGILAKVSNEITTNLIAGGAKFSRHEASLQMNALILPRYDLIGQFSVMAGTLLKPHKVNLCDKFFAGGPMTVRGFKFQGLGPNNRDYPLGDLSYLSAGVHLYSILPMTRPESTINQHIRPHIFLNTGTIGNLFDSIWWTSRDELKQSAIRLRDSLRYSCGLGLVLHFQSWRLEVNYCIPLRVKERDIAWRGFHWGFGITYT